MSGRLGWTRLLVVEFFTDDFALESEFDFEYEFAHVFALESEFEFESELEIEF